MEAVLQQAGLGTFVSFRTHTGKPCGGAVLDFASFYAAEHCVRHFDGCQWDGSGTSVSAKILPMDNAGAELAGKKQMVSDAKLSAEAAVFEPLQQRPVKVIPMETIAQAPTWSKAKSTTLSAETSAFQFPGKDLVASSQATVFTPPAVLSTLSAKAPSFVPASVGAEERDAGVHGAAKREKLGVSSDTSTEVGESEAEDEKGSPRLLVPT